MLSIQSKKSTILVVLVLGMITQMQVLAREVILYATDAQTIHIIPLDPGIIPSLDSDNYVPVILPSGCEDDISQPVTIVPLKTSGHFLTVWWNEAQNRGCYSHFAPDERGCNGFIEIYQGEWESKPTPPIPSSPAETNPSWWFPAPTGVDLNEDGIDEIVLIQRTNYADNYYFYYKVAVGMADGSFDFSLDTRHLLISPPARGAYFLLEKINNDNLTDLVFHSFSWGGDYSTNLYMIPGQDSGLLPSFDLTSKQLILSFSQGATSPVFGDFNEDSNPDVFLPPDDDVDDLGQAYISFGNGTGQFHSVVESIDFEPSHEYPTSDEFSALAQTCDINSDGHLDILASEFWTSVYSTINVYLGKGNGQFSSSKAELLHIPASKPLPNLVCMSPHFQACKVTLSYLTAKSTDNNVLLEWETTDETNSIAFQLIRGIPKKGKKCSKKISDYAEITSLKKVANSDEPLLIYTTGGIGKNTHYSYVDREVKSGMTYCYVLKELDSNSNSKYYLDFIASSSVPLK